MFKKYEEPVVEIIELCDVDVIRTSTGNGFDDEIVLG